MPTPENLLISAILLHKRKDILIQQNFTSENMVRFEDEMFFILQSREIPSLKTFKSKFSNFRINKVPATDIEHLIDLCKRNKINSDLAKLLKSSVTDIQNGKNPSDITLELERKSRQINNQFINVTSVDIFEGNMYLYRYLDKRQKVKKEKALGIPYGFKGMDDITGGMQDSELITVAARTKIGKTFVMCRMAANAIITGKNVTLFSLEMEWDMIASRIFSILSYELGRASKTKTPGDILLNSDLNLGKISAKKVHRILENIKKEIKGSFLVPDIRGKFSIETAGRMIEKLEPDLAIFDYFGLAELESGRIENWMQAADASHTAKEIARMYNIPFILGAQLNRSGTQTPTGDNIAITDSIKQDSDKVYILTKRSYDKLKLFCDKYRGGPDSWAVIIDWDVNRGKIRQIRFEGPKDEDN